MPQDAESDSELKNLAAVPFQIISPANNKAIIGMYQDSLLGAYLFSKKNISFTQRDAMNLLMMFKRVNEHALRKDVITNFDLLTQIMPPLTLNYKTKLFGTADEKDKANSNNILEIKNGVWIRGQMEKDVLGAGSKGLIHRICNDYGNMACADFIDDMQNIITTYLKTASYSVGISDLISNAETNSEIVKN